MPRREARLQLKDSFRWGGRPASLDKLKGLDRPDIPFKAVSLAKVLDRLGLDFDDIPIREAEDPPNRFGPGNAEAAKGARRRRLTDALLREIGRPDAAEKFVRAGVQAAMGGDFQFWKYIFERIEGAMPARLQVEEKPAAKVLKVPPGRRRRKAPDDLGT